MSGSLIVTRLLLAPLARLTLARQESPPPRQRTVTENYTAHAMPRPAQVAPGTYWYE